VNPHNSLRTVPGAIEPTLMLSPINCRRSPCRKALMACLEAL
jgi:hypothetical protein